jgi:rhodanese-related sulfurtransferase
MRSRRVAEYLNGSGRFGFHELVNVAGGIAAFAVEVDPKTGEY